MSVRSSVTEINVEVRRKQYDPKIEFVERSRPPKVKKVGYNSYLNGSLYVGDEVIGLNDEEIRTADDFNRIVCARSNEPARLRIRVRRDCYYKINIKRVEGEQGKGEVLDLEIKWRRGGMPLGVSMEDSRGRITISEIQAGSIADGNFHYGDVMTHVNGKRVTDIKSARPAILEAINNNKSLTIRVERPEQLGEVSHLPADVAKIIKRQINFHRHAHKYSAAITSAEREATTSSILSRITEGLTGRTSSRSSRRSSPEVGTARVTIQRPSSGDVRAIPADTNADLKRTPPRPGSQ
uniref:PDZ domain-containing protein n=1 Tax=Meloidogyne incognita TaxID=6306 RepID=A0A914MDM7_MELIC